MNIEITQIHTDSLACEPLLTRTPNGELLCLCQCDGPTEPHPENREYAFHSKDNGKSWSAKQSVYPEDGNAVYCTGMTVLDNEITAFLTVHTGRFADWNCRTVKSRDNGYTWQDGGVSPCFSNYAFIRKMFRSTDGRLLIPYHAYPTTALPNPSTEQESVFCYRNTPACVCGLMESRDGGKTWTDKPACKLSLAKNWIWAETTVAETQPGHFVMLLRHDLTGWLYRCESTDGGNTWGEVTQTDIPNPGNKPLLIPLDKSRIALLHTPSHTARNPYELWISEDGLQTFSQKIRLTDFPGQYSYSDGFYEDGHLRFVIEHNRHTILYFDVTL